MIHHRPSADDSGEKRFAQNAKGVTTMEMPLFPLSNVVLFPGMVLPLHIFEPRYREMINRCINDRTPFGVVLIADGPEVGGDARPHLIGTAAQVTRVERYPDGRMDILAIGGQRFKVLELHNTHSYLSGTVESYPLLNGQTRNATEMAEKVRPYVIKYIDLLSQATHQKLQLDRLPEDPTTLAFLVAISLQVNNRDKQKLLEMTSIPEMLAREAHLLSREMLFTQFMIDTQHEASLMNEGPTGCLFPN